MFARRLTLDFDGRRLRGVRPFARFEVRGSAAAWQGDVPRFRGSPLEQLRAALQWARATHGESGAAIGFVGYEFARCLEPASLRAAPSEPDDPLAALPDVRLDFCRVLTKEAIPPAPPFSLPGEAPPLSPDDEYRRGVGRIREFIARGDIYQANLTRRFHAPLPCPPAQLFDRLRAAHPMPFAALLEWDDFALVSNSPERFLKLRDGVLMSQPIKGTMRRGVTAEDDAALKTALQSSIKDRAENVMIVDLLRNDLGRVCKMGSVSVPALCEVQTFPTLHHLVSTVRGALRPGCDALDAFAAAFPCGSITGAPKIRAMQILQNLEPVRRGAAMGALGYFGFDGGMEWNVAIRTATCIGDAALWHAGGGIVWDSDAAGEEAEMRLKAGAIARALQVP